LLTISVLSTLEKLVNHGKNPRLNDGDEEVGDGSQNRDEEYDERRAVETPLDLDETVRSL
jgi:hypothetical protein